MKTAKIVYVSLATRIIVDSNLTEEEQIEEAIRQSKMKLIDKIENELYENIQDIFEDTECPYDEQFDS